MGRNEFHLALMLYAKSIPFEALVMAAMLTAEERDEKKLKSAFPKIWQEVKTRSDTGKGPPQP